PTIADYLLRITHREAWSTTMTVGFTILVLVTITAAVVVVTTRNIIHAAVFLGGAFTGVAGIYLLLDAPFIAAAQVLIYVGAITVLILFALMMTAQTVMRPSRRENEWRLLAGVLSFVLFGVLVVTLLRAQWAVGIPAPPERDHSLTGLANGLLGTYLIPF